MTRPRSYAMAEAAVSEEDPLQSLLARLRGAAKGRNVSVQDLVESTGEHSFATLLFVVSLIMVTPLSGIPTAPTIGAVIIALIVGQWALGRDHLWLPGWIARREVSSEKFCKGLEWAGKPAAFIDRHTRARLTPLARRPLKVLPLAAILLIVATWPFLEILPFFTTLCAVAVALFAFGLMVKDGLYVLAGYAYVAVLGLIAGSYWLL